MLRRIYCLLLLLPVLAGAAINAAAFPHPDTSYVLKYRDQVHISTGLQNNNSAIVLTDLASRQTLYLNPRQSQQQFLKLEYRNMVFKYGLSPQYLNPDVSSLTGKTSRRSFGYSFGLGPVGFSINYEQSKGYYLDNTADFDTSWRPGQPYIQFGDLRSVLYGVELSYNVRSTFSEAAVNSCRERQLRVNYSFIPTLTVNYITYTNGSISTDSVPVTATRYWDCNGKFLLAGSLPLFRTRLQLSGIAGPILGVSFVRDRVYSKQLSGNADERTILMSLGYMFNVGLSFNERHWFAGINAFAERYGNNQSGARLEKAFYGIQLYAGIRIREPRPLKNLADRTFKQLNNWNPLKPPLQQ